MGYYDYRSYLNTIIQQLSGLETDIISLQSQINMLYDLIICLGAFVIMFSIVRYFGGHHK